MVKAGATKLCLDAETDEQPARGGGAGLILFAHNLAAAEMVLRVRQVQYHRGTDVEHGDYLEVVDPDGYTLSISKT
jgi:hypothetical protein